MGELYPKTERLQLTNHDVLGGAPRYSANMEEVDLTLDPEPPHASFSITSEGFPSDSNFKGNSRTDKVLLLLFGITSADLHGLGRILLSCAVFSILVLIGLIVHIFVGPPQIAPHGAVATDVPECSAIGVNILKRGGSAVDAAIAAVFCLQVVNPQSAGMGGGGFMMIYNHKTKLPYYIDFRETAPSGFRTEMMDELGSKPYLGIGIPGDLRGLHHAYKRYGKLGWPSLVLPAAKLAREGFEVSKPLVQDLWRFDRIKDLPSSQKLKDFLYPGGKPLQIGQRITRPQFAATLDRIAYNGAEELYIGALGRELIKEVESLGGILTQDDLRNYNVSTPEPVSTTFRDYLVLTGPAPSAGPSALLALNILEGFNLTRDDVNSPVFWHRFIETLKFAFANKNRLGDPAFEPSVNDVMNSMIQKPFADKLRSFIRDNATLSDYSLGVNVTQPNPYGTTHLSVIDPNDLYVSLTTTLNHYCGSGVMTSSGIVLNDELADFADSSMASSQQANYPKPGKRPLSSMVPMVVYHPKRACTNRVAIGGSNGTHIPSGVLNSLLNILVFGMNVTNAIEYPRVFADLATNPVLVESLLAKHIVAGLRSFGQNISVVADGLSVVQAVLKSNKTVTAHSDSRKDGAAAVF